jgi:uncharacterized protein with HEPN domain
MLLRLSDAIRSICMKRRDVRAFLWDIEKTCRDLDTIVAGKTFQDYLTNAGIRMAVERGFEILGEAMRNVVEQRPDFAQRFSDPSGVISFRNRVAHEYWRVISDVVWAALHDDVPILREQATSLLRELPPAEDGDLPA